MLLLIRDRNHPLKPNHTQQALNFTMGLFIQVTLAKTEIIYPKNVGAQVAMDFT